MVFWAWTEMREISVCSSVRFGCVLPWRVMAGASLLVTCERKSREDAIWPLTREACRTGWRWGVLTLGPKGPSWLTTRSNIYFYTNRPPCYGRGCGVRIVVDSTPPVGGSVWSCRETALSSLEDFAPARPGKGSTASRGLSLAVWALRRRLSQTRRRWRVLSTYMAFSRTIGPGTDDDRFRSYSSGYSCTTSADYLNL
jgi:hypothetical protein